MSLLAELKRRKVLRVGGAYLVVAWLLIQVVATLGPMMQVPEWAPRLITLLLMLGLPIALVMAWVFEVTPDGLKVEAATVGNKPVLAVAAVLATLALGWFMRGMPAAGPQQEALADGPRSIAVLPFTSLGEDAESTGLAGGLHDTLITQLSKLKGLEVRSRTSVMKYRDWTGGMPAIAEELKVNVLLEGSVQRIGNRTVVNAQLIDARTDAHLWAETIDRTGDDLFGLQAEIAQRVVSELRVALSPEERKALTEAPTRDSQAYALYVQAMQTFNNSSLPQGASEREAQRAQAADLLRAALARDPEFALAWAALTQVLATAAWQTTEGDYRRYVEQARAAAANALAFGESLPEARYARGVVLLQLDLDFVSALPELEYAAEHMPNVAGLQAVLCWAYRYNGRWDDNLRAARRALELDPTNAHYARTLASALLASQKWEEFDELMHAQAALRPDSYHHARDLALAQSMRAGSFDAVRAFIADAKTRFPTEGSLVALVSGLSMVDGDPAAALAALDATPAGGPDGWLLRERGDALHALGRESEAKAVYAAAREQVQLRLNGDRDPYVEAVIRASLAYLDARLGAHDLARENMVRADALWGYAREPSDGGFVWATLLPAHVALGEFEAACAKVRTLVENPSFNPAPVLWMDLRIAELHRHECFRTLMRAHGVDVEREPFAANRKAAAL
jgi:TolB-like protein